MSSIRVRVTLLALPLVLLAACGSDGADPGASSGSSDTGVVSPADAGSEDSGSPDVSSPEVSADAGVKEQVGKFDADMAAAVCEKLASCCSSADYGVFWAQFQTEFYGLKSGEIPAADKCAATLGTMLHKLHDRWVVSIGRGRMRFDEAKGAACVKAVGDAACGVPLTNALYDGQCWGNRAATFEKLARPGDTCEDVGDGTYNGECAPDLGYCEGPSSKYPTRKCVAWHSPGEECSIVPTWQFCDTRKGSNCDGGTPSKPGKCSDYGKTIKLGEICSASLGPTNLCESGTYCDFDSGKCTAQKADGATCKYDDECKTAHAFTCLPFDPTGAGGKCGSATFCSKGAK